MTPGSVAWRHPSTLADAAAPLAAPGEDARPLAGGRSLIPIGCESSHCVCCMVDMNGESVTSCGVFVSQAHGAGMTTIEGAADADGALPVLQEMFRERHGLPCGWRTPGTILRARRLLAENPSPSEAAMRMGVAGDLGRCTGCRKAAAAQINARQEAALRTT